MWYKTCFPLTHSEFIRNVFKFIFQILVEDIIYLKDMYKNSTGVFTKPLSEIGNILLSSIRFLGSILGKKHIWKTGVIQFTTEKFHTVQH